MDIVEEKKSYNIRMDSDLVEFVENAKRGNASTIIRAATWCLMLGPDPDAVVKLYGEACERKSMSNREIAERLQQIDRRARKRTKSRTG